MISRQCFDCLNNYRYAPMYPETPAPSVPQTQQPPQPQGPTSDFEVAPGAPTTLGVEYTQGYLRTQIGKRVKIFFLIGTNIIQDRDGIIEDVGISYIILKEAETNNLVLCDIYAIKFVTIYP